MTIQEHLKELQNEMERKIHEMKLFYENEKQESKRQHTRIYQDLLEETNQVRRIFHSPRSLKTKCDFSSPSKRLKKMESDYKSQQTINESSIHEMEKRMVDLRANLDRLQQTKQKLEEDNAHLSKANEQLQIQVEHH